jgi:hypothetical protein
MTHQTYGMYLLQPLSGQLTCLKMSEKRQEHIFKPNNRILISTKATHLLEIVAIDFAVLVNQTL